MVNVAVLLLIVGIILLAIEAFIPGFGFFGVGGVISVAASAVLLFIHSPFGPLIVAVEGLLLAGMIVFVFKFFKSNHARGKLILDESLPEDESLTLDTERFMGRRGMVITPLRPIGTAEFSGLVLEVRSEGAFIETGDRVEIVGALNNCFIVKRLMGNEN